MDSPVFVQFKKYLCYDTVITVGLIYVTLQFIPGFAAIGASLPIPGGSSSVTVSEVMVAAVAASLISSPISKHLCKADL